MNSIIINCAIVIATKQEKNDTLPKACADLFLFAYKLN